jgi:hypothetical protein
MATQRYNSADLFAASPSLAVHNRSMAGSVPSFTSDRSINSKAPDDVVQAYRACVDRRLLGKGVSWGLGIEGAIAITFYAMWRLLHLLIS